MVLLKAGPRARKTCGLCLQEARTDTWRAGESGLLRLLKSLRTCAGESCGLRSKSTEPCAQSW